MTNKDLSKQRSAINAAHPSLPNHFTQKLCPFSKLVLNLFSWLFLLWFGWLFLSLCFFNNSTFTYNFWAQSAAALLLAAGIIGCYHLVRKARAYSKQLRYWMNHRFLLIFFISMSIILIFQLVYVWLASTPVGWDVRAVMHCANNESWIEWYPIQYPNNLFLILCFRGLINIFNWFQLSNIWLGLNIVNAIAVNAAIIFTVLTARMLFSIRSTYITWFFCIITLAFIPYLIIPYSDTLAMPFAIGILYCYIRLRDAKSTKFRLLYSVLAGLCTCIGMLIKPTVIIPFIAIVLIHSLFNLTNKKRLLYSAAYLMLTLIIFVTANASFHSFSSNFYKPNPNREIPLTHFMMMGLHEETLPNGTSRYGAYNEPDVDATKSQPTKQTKIAYNLDIIKSRLKDMGFFNYISYLNNKARWITSEGNFFWGGEGGFADFNNMKESFIKDLINPGAGELRADKDNPVGKYYNIYLYFSQAVWIVLMFCIVAPLFLKRRRGYGHEGVMILRCSVFGLMLFLLLFEGRSRYLVNQLPYFILLASYGLNACICAGKKRRHTNSKQKET